MQNLKRKTFQKICVKDRNYLAGENAFSGKIFHLYRDGFAFHIFSLRCFTDVEGEACGSPFINSAYKSFDIAETVSAQ